METLQIQFENEEESSLIKLPLDNENFYESQIGLKVELVDWKNESGGPKEVVFGLKNTEVLVLNDIGKNDNEKDFEEFYTFFFQNLDPGTLGFSKPSLTFNESEEEILVPIHRIGGMDGEVSVKWRTIEGTAREGRDYLGDSGVVNFSNNQVSNQNP